MIHKSIQFVDINHLEHTKQVNYREIIDRNDQFLGEITSQMRHSKSVWRNVDFPEANITGNIVTRITAIAIVPRILPSFAFILRRK